MYIKRPIIQDDNNTILCEKKKKMIDTEKPKEVKGNKLWVGYTLVVIGIFIIVGVMVGYYIEETNCPGWTCGGIPPLHSAGGMGVFAFALLSLIFIVPGIIYPYRKRIKRSGAYCCILLLFIPIMGYALTGLMILNNFAGISVVIFIGFIGLYLVVRSRKKI
ncbi:MAG: hypothetical protein ACXAAH_02880 [Promethearchaeota archaeon]|jgi:uncharacterized membrane protein YhaH (DUF805 family)